MRNLIFTAALLLLALKGAANNGELAREASEKLKKAVIMPESFKTRHGSHKVCVSFLVNESGKVTEVFVDCADKDARRDISNQFLQMEFAGLAPCVRHSVEINFIYM